MTERASTNSRQYRFAYRILDMSDIPADFSIALPEDERFTAIFMPGDTEAYWLHPDYPPRIYVLTCDTLIVYSHRSSGDPPYVASLKELEEAETQQALLHGIIRFDAEFASRCFRTVPFIRNI